MGTLDDHSIKYHCVLKKCEKNFLYKSMIVQNSKNFWFSDFSWNSDVEGYPAFTHTITGYLVCFHILQRWEGMEVNVLEMKYLYLKFLYLKFFGSLINW